MYSDLYKDCVVNPRRDKCWIVEYNGLYGLSAQATEEEEGLLRLVGSFPKARLVLGEVAENLCVRRRIDGVRYPASDSSAGLHVGSV